jgi:hypothetical protein
MPADLPLAVGEKERHCLNSRCGGGESGGGARPDMAVEEKKTPRSKEWREKATSEAETPKVTEAKQRVDGGREAQEEQSREGNGDWRRME